MRKHTQLLVAERLLVRRRRDACDCTSTTGDYQQAKLSGEEFTTATIDR